MAKPRRNEDEGVSLFPFMSILACLIGILTLMISVSMTANQAKQGLSQEELDRAKENDKLKREMVKIQEDIEALKEKSKTENASALDLQKLQNQQKKLKKTLDQLEKPDEDKAQLEQKIKMMRLETAAIQKEQPTLEKRIAELKAELEKRKIQPKPKESVQISPGGSMRALQGKLRFVECSSTGIVIREKNKEPITISTAAIAESVEFAEFCTRTASIKDGQVVFLLRKAGQGSYRWAAGVAQTTYGLNVGKLPIPNDGEIDLSLFDKR
jgi:hypothetical protein